MRFFTSISIAALCFVASIQAAPAPQLPPEFAGLTGGLPIIGPIVAPPAPGDQGTGSTTDGTGGATGGLTGGASGLTGNLPVSLP